MPSVANCVVESKENRRRLVKRPLSRERTLVPRTQGRNHGGEEKPNFTPHSMQHETVLVHGKCCIQLLGIINGHAFIS